MYNLDDNAGLTKIRKIILLRKESIQTAVAF